MIDIRKDVAKLLRDFISGEAQPYALDDFVCVRNTDPVIEDVRIQIANVPYDYPSLLPQRYCSDLGIQRILELAKYLESD